MSVMICDKEKCTGCKLCQDICPVGAITFLTDDQGFWYPVIDDNKCIKCNRCHSYCPITNHTSFQDESFVKVYSSYSKDDELRINSTSGGVFGTIARKILRDGGLVAGCAYNDDWKSAKHIIINSENELHRVIGSKYFQSDTSGIYKAIEKALQDKRIVLFCGTPCQIAAARAYFGDNPSLIYIDFICRSINSPLAFMKYLEELENEYESKVKKVHLKNKDLGWQSLATKVYFESGEYSLKDKNEDYWVKGFITNGLYTRPSCNNCLFREIPHKNADVTLGDFWGIANQSQDDIRKGISVVLVDSNRGLELINSVKSELFLEEHSISEVLLGNIALKKDPMPSRKQELFFTLLKNKKFSTCVKKCSKSLLIIRFYKKIKRVVIK